MRLKSFLGSQKSPWSGAGRALAVCAAGVSAAAMLLASPAGAWKPLGSTWDAEKGPVQYALNSAGSEDLPGDADELALLDAFRLWTCSQPTSLRFERIPVDGPAEANAGDGINSLFWAETQAARDEAGMGPSTLGVMIGTPGQGGDIVFNGFDHTWSTDGSGTDVRSVALHEIGHFIGFAHSCEDENDESTCTPEERTVMRPSGNAIEPGPQEDDLNGLENMYPATDNATCEGPYRQGEACAHNCECVEGLICLGQIDGSQVCTKRCGGTEQGGCGTGFACVLGARKTNGAESEGACMKVPYGTKQPVASSCEVDGQCEQGRCRASRTIGRTVCRFTCDEAADCPGDNYRCVEKECVGPSSYEGIECPDEPSGCGCNATASRADMAGAGLAGLLFFLLRRRRR